MLFKGTEFLKEWLQNQQQELTESVKIVKKKQFQISMSMISKVRNLRYLELDYEYEDLVKSRIGLPSKLEEKTTEVRDTDSSFPANSDTENESISNQSFSETESEAEFDSENQNTDFSRVCNEITQQSL